jgi:hypothetical protein
MIHAPHAFLTLKWSVSPAISLFARDRATAGTIRSPRFLNILRYIRYPRAIASKI